jgi:hypothetical protein
MADNRYISAQELARGIGLLYIAFEKHIANLKQKLQSLVEFRGPPKTGGYYLTEKMWAKLGKHS